MSKRLGKTMAMAVLSGVLMLGSSMTVFAGGGEEVDEPMTDPIYTESTEIPMPNRGRQGAGSIYSGWQCTACG